MRSLNCSLLLLLFLNSFLIVYYYFPQYTDPGCKDFIPHAILLKNPWINLTTHHCLVHTRLFSSCSTATASFQRSVSVSHTVDSQVVKSDIKQRGLMFVFYIWLSAAHCLLFHLYFIYCQLNYFHVWSLNIGESSHFPDVPTQSNTASPEYVHAHRVFLFTWGTGDRDLNNKMDDCLTATS